MIPTQPTRWSDYPVRMLRQRALKFAITDSKFVHSVRLLDIPEPPRRSFDPRQPLTGLALRLLAVSNAWRQP